jgi:hypothetical protein
MVWKIPRLLGFWNGNKHTVCPFHDRGTVCMVTCDRNALWIFDNGYMPRAAESGVSFDCCFSWGSRTRLHSDG